MAEYDGDKSLEPTVQRRQRARAEGQVARSQDLCSAGLLLGGLGILLFTGGALVEFLVGFVGTYLSGGPWMHLIHSGQPVNAELVTGQWQALVPSLAEVLLPVLGLTMLLAVGMNMLQTGFLFLPQKLAPDLSRINPLAGLARQFSGGNAIRLFLGIVKLAVMAGVAAACLYDRREQWMSLVDLDLPQIALVSWDLMLGMCFRMGLALFALAVADYGYQRWKHEQDLKMTPQEMREEMRNQQGDPQLLARRRAVQRQLSLSRLAQVVPKADLVIVKAAELAIALRYDAETMAAPVVIAKGAGSMAGQIQRLALEHGIPTIEKHPLADRLHADSQLNRPVGQNVFAEVAEVLAYAYQRQNKTVRA